MIKRLRIAFNKLAFCYRISSSINVFIRLIVNTKKYAAHKAKHASAEANDEIPVCYDLILNGVQKLVYLRTYSGDLDIFYEIFWKMVYKPDETHSAKIQTIVDLGANIGMTGLFFSVQFPGAAICTVEPDADNFEVLTTNLADEILSGKLIPLRAAISPDNGLAYIQKKERAYNTIISPEAISGMQVRTINIYTLLKEMMITEIDLLKIDIEGWEAHLFNGDTNWLDIVNTIVMECHSPAIKVYCEQLLQSKGFILSPGNKNASSLLWAVKNN